MLPEAPRPPAGTLVATLAASLLLVLAVSLPPETMHPWSRAACQMVAAAAVLLAWRRVRPEGLLCWAGLVPFAVAAVLGAACRSRAVDESADAVLLILAGMLGRGVAARPGARRAVTTVLVAVATGAALQAVLQRHLTYPSRAAEIRAAPEGDVHGVLYVLESGRPSGPFTLPAALGGFLALALPLSLAEAARRGRWSAGRAGALAAVMVQIYALGLSRSIGAVVALTAGLLLAGTWRRPRGRLLAGAAIILLAALACGYFLRARRLEIAAARGTDPLTLRLGNWSAAAGMIRDHPLFGGGPGSFGTLYPRYMRPGMNETRYAHESYLQAAAGWGLWILVPIGALVLAFARGARRAASADGTDRAVAAGGCAFLVHNLGDFTAYLPGVAIPGSILVGMALGGAGLPEAPRREARRRARACAALVLLPLAILYGWTATARALCRTRLEAAVEAAEENDLRQAATLARAAEEVRPADPDPHAFVAQMILAHFRDDGRRMAEGETEAATALAADPEAAILHYTRSLYHLAAGEPAPAYRERYAAHLLYPLKPLYADPPPAGEADR